MSGCAYGMYEAWSYMCTTTLREGVVPITEVGPGTLSHTVAPGAPPLHCADGDVVRAVTLGYFLGDLEHEHSQRDAESTYAH